MTTGQAPGLLGMARKAKGFAQRVVPDALNLGQYLFKASRAAPSANSTARSFPPWAHFANLPAWNRQSMDDNATMETWAWGYTPWRIPETAATADRGLVGNPSQGVHVDRCPWRGGRPYFGSRGCGGARRR